jgi:DNA-binding response OmpR family regulator
LVCLHREADAGEGEDPFSGDGRSVMSEIFGNSTDAAAWAGDRPRVLLVDDDPNLHETLRIALGDRYDILGVLTGEEALSLMEKDVPDLVILDLNLPGKDGLDVCRELRSRVTGRRLPVLFLTAEHSHERFVRGMESGGDSFMTKPFRLEELVERIESLLGGPGEAVG